MCSQYFEGVPTHNLIFKNSFTAWPGHSADSCVLKHSPFSQTLPELMDNNSEYLYRSGTVNSKSFVGKVFLRIKRKFELTYAL